MACVHACVIKNCKTNARHRNKASDLTFHEFPLSAERREKWINAVHLSRPPDWRPSRYSYICSVHFNETDFYSSNRGIRRIKPTAVPIYKLLETDGSECNEDLDTLEVKEVIVGVYRYLQTEYEQLKQWTGHSCDLSPLANILKRAAAATGVSEHTVTSLLEHDQPSDEEPYHVYPKRPRVDIHSDPHNASTRIYFQKEQGGQEQYETGTEQEHYGQNEEDYYNITDILTIKYEDDDDEKSSHNRLKQTPQEQNDQEQTHQEQTSQEQNSATKEQKQYEVRIKQEKDDEASGPSEHILVKSEPVAVKIEPGYWATTITQQSSQRSKNIIIETGHYQDQLKPRHSIILNNNKKERQKRYREQNREKLKQREKERRARKHISQSIARPSTSPNTNRIKLHNEEVITGQSSSGSENPSSIQRNVQRNELNALQKKRKRQQRYREQNRDILKQREAERRRRLLNTDVITELSTSPNIQFKGIINYPVINEISTKSRSINGSEVQHLVVEVSQEFGRSQSIANTTEIQNNYSQFRSVKCEPADLPASETDPLS